MKHYLQLESASENQLYTVGSDAPHSHKSENMLFCVIPSTFRMHHGSGFTFRIDHERDVCRKKIHLDNFKLMETRSTVEANMSNVEEDNIEKHVCFLDARFRVDDILRLRAILTEKTWIAFDLDDTLHDFRRSTGLATNRVLAEISNDTKHLYLH